MRNKLKVFAMADIAARPGALPLPADRSIQAFTKPDVFDRWGDDLAALRPSALEIGDNVITMFDTIGEDYWSGGGVTAKKVAAQLRAIGDRPVQVQINSPGGDMFEGIAIYNILREHPQQVTVKVMGMAASAASIIAMAGDDIQIGSASFLMIHNCWVLAVGNRHDMAETSAWLAPFDQAMADVYAARTGMDAAATAKLMDAETYLSGSQAVDQGFADSLLSSDKIAPDAKAQANAKEISEMYALERTLIAGGKTRAEARATLQKIKGKPGAADEVTPSADDFDWVKAAADLKKTLLN
jgi:ATP-dependent protease ClpP protease subunit